MADTVDDYDLMIPQLDFYSPDLDQSPGNNLSSSPSDYWLLPDNVTSNMTSSVVPPAEASLTEVIGVSIVVAILALITSGGNLMVLISFKMDRQLQTVSNYFLLSLAVADFAIGVVSMPLFTVYLLMKRWPLGPIVCDAWLSLDYTMSNASVANLLIISFDRYFSVTRPLTYRARRTPRKAGILIATAWVVSILLWTPWIWTWPYIEGERSVLEDECFIQFIETNRYVTLTTAFAAFYLPVVIMCIIYYNIYQATERRQRDLAILQPAVTNARRHFSLRPIINNKSLSLPTNLTRRSNCTSTDNTPSPRTELPSTPASATTPDIDPGTPRTVHRTRRWPWRSARTAAANSIENTDDDLLTQGSAEPPNYSDCHTDGNGGVGSGTGSTRQIGRPSVVGVLSRICRRQPSEHTTTPLQSPVTSITLEDMSSPREEFSPGTCGKGGALESRTPRITVIAEETSCCGLACDADVAECKCRLAACRTVSAPAASDASLAAGAGGIDGATAVSDSVICCHNDWNEGASLNNSAEVADDALSSKSTTTTTVVQTPTTDDTRSQLRPTGSNGQRQLQSRRQEKKQERKAAKTLSAILLAFIITWTPYNVFIVVKAFCTKDCISEQLYNFAYWLCYLNSTVNPVLYALCNANFRRTYWHILTCRWVKRPRPVMRPLLSQQPSVAPATNNAVHRS